MKQLWNSERLLLWVLLIALLSLLVGCSSLVDKAATGAVGSGTATAGAALGYAVAGPAGAITGAGVGGATGAVLAESAVMDKPPPTFFDLLEQLIAYGGWSLILLILAPYIMGWITDKPKHMFQSTQSTREKGPSGSFFNGEENERTTVNTG